MATNKHGRWTLLVLLLALAPAPQVLATPARALPGLPVTPVTSAQQDPRQRWASMAPARQRELRARYAAWRSLSDSERSRIRRSAAAVAALPTQQQAALRSRFDGQDQLHRDGWRLGPGLGAVYPKLQPLFGYLPAEQRAPALVVLRGLDDAQLAQLVLISQRTPPQDRESVREQLLAQAPAARAAWLREKVGR